MGNISHGLLGKRLFLRVVLPRLYQLFDLVCRWPTYGAFYWPKPTYAVRRHTMSIFIYFITTTFNNKFFCKISRKNFWLEFNILDFHFWSREFFLYNTERISEQVHWNIMQINYGPNRPCVEFWVEKRNIFMQNWKYEDFRHICYTRLSGRGRLRWTVRNHRGKTNKKSSGMRFFFLFFNGFFYLFFLPIGD